VVFADLVLPGGLTAMRWSRRPIVHFFAIGAVLYFAKLWGSSGEHPAIGVDEAGPIVITAERVEELRSDWLARTGSPPSEAELAAALRLEIDDELLVREARRQGVHRNDSVVVRRLLLNMQFLEGAAERSAEDLLADAYALGMDRSDLVVRRRLVQQQQLDVFATVRTPEPTEAELLGYMQRHPELFTRPARAKISHVFLSRDRRGNALAADAEALLARLVRDGVGVEAARELGDPFLISIDLAPRSERELAKVFGPEFAERALALPTARWSGPVASAYGAHLVWVHERTPAAPARLESVRNAVREAVLGERGERALREYLAELRERWPVRVEAPDVFRSDAG
jgi:hypothetical protein